VIESWLIQTLFPGKKSIPTIIWIYRRPPLKIPICSEASVNAWKLLLYVINDNVPSCMSYLLGTHRMTGNLAYVALQRINLTIKVFEELMFICAWQKKSTSKCIFITLKGIDTTEGQSRKWSEMGWSDLFELLLTAYTKIPACTHTYKSWDNMNKTWWQLSFWLIVFFLSYICK
jgi:hypothetical protein